jgi:hypothetical protein
LKNPLRIGAATLPAVLLYGSACGDTQVSTPSWPVLQQYADRVVLVDFWASWCVPCLRSFPWMNELSFGATLWQLSVGPTPASGAWQVGVEFLCLR